MVFWWVSVSLLDTAACCLGLEVGVDAAEEPAGLFSYMDWVMPDTAMLTGRGRLSNPADLRLRTSAPPPLPPPPAPPAGLRRLVEVPSRLKPCWWEAWYGGKEAGEKNVSVSQRVHVVRPAQNPPCKIQY